MIGRVRVVIALGAAAAITGTAFGQRAPIFQSEVLPVLEKHCNRCHGPQTKSGGLDLSGFAGLMAGGSAGRVIEPRKPESSLLWTTIQSNHRVDGGELTDAEKQLLRTYIEQGRFPSTDAARKAPAAAKVSPSARQWWSFQRPVKGDLPAVRHHDQVRTPIDAFVLAKLEERGWTLAEQADRATLIRRVTLDLTGLLPTSGEVSAFVADSSADAYGRLIDRLLASPHYGEQWGRHWLDVAGYSDSIGDASDVEREVAWKYRDYAIRAFNTNKPIDRFLVEQFAGDQLVNYEPQTQPRPDQVEPLIATGFLRMTADITDNQTIYEVDKYFDALEKATETSLKAVTGLTFGCARCHNHKFDPILQSDYYKLEAVFQASYDPENWLAANLSYGEWPSRMVMDMPIAQRDEWIRSTQEIRREVQVLANLYEAFRKVAASGTQTNREERAAIVKRVSEDPNLVIDPHLTEGDLKDPALEKQFPELGEQKARMRQIRERHRKQGPKPNYIMALWDVSRTPSPTYILKRGNYLAPGAAVEPGIPEVLDDTERPFSFPNPKDHAEWHHTGRRLTLAQWLTRPEHPLTARVFVNRIWQFHFGDGLVRSPDDFGLQGTRPTHPELLDWLAVSFVEHGWDLNWLHREILLSATYRQSSGENAQKLAVDASNKLLWRKVPLRLNAEAVRDSMLQVSGLLSPEMFGSQQPLKRSTDGQFAEDASRGNPNRRSIYLSYARTRPDGFLRAFDCPDMTSDSQSQRFRSALPVQALALLNNPLTRRTSLALAENLMRRSNGNVEEAIALAFQEVYSRKADEREIRVARQTVAGHDSPSEGMRLLVQAMMAANEFLYSF